MSIIHLNNFFVIREANRLIISYQKKRYLSGNRSGKKYIFIIIGPVSINTFSDNVRYILFLNLEKNLNSIEMT